MLDTPTPTTTSTFRAGWQRHFEAVTERDFAELVATTAPDGVVLVGADGDVSFGSDRFLELHRAWFAVPGWRMEHELLHEHVVGDLGVVLLRLDYHVQDEQGRASHDASLLSLVLERRDDDWLVVQDQNTPLR